MKKIFTILVSALFLFSYVGFALAQEPNLAVTIPEGSGIESDFETTTTQLSSVLGAVSSIITETIINNIIIGSTEIWREEFIDGISQFEIFVFGSGSSPNFNDITIIGEFETTEPNVEVRNIVGTWVTQEVISTIQEAGNDHQIAVLLNGENIIFNDGKWVQITQLSISGVGFISSEEPEGGNKIIEDCSIGGYLRCPDSSQIEILKNQMGITTIVESGYQDTIILGMSNSHIYVFKDDLGVWYIVGNLDYSSPESGQFSYDFTAPITLEGYSVLSQDGVSLAILNANEVVDIYAVI